MHTYIDPEVLAALEPLAGPALDAENLLKRRAQVPPLDPVPETIEEGVHVVDEVTGVSVYSYRPKQRGGALPCLYSIHGGGYVLGKAVMDRARLARWASIFGCVCVSVDYRLAPEAPFPGPLEDCYGGLRWVLDQADGLGVDRSRIGITGRSAGGGLGAALALLVRDRGEFAVAFQALECPMIDDRQSTWSSQLEKLPIWNRLDNEFGWGAYLGPLYGSESVPYLAAPARATDLSRLPPTYLSVGTADLFCDEVIDYGIRLNQAGTPTDVGVYAGAPHGLVIAAQTRLAERWVRHLEEWLAGYLSS